MINKYTTESVPVKIPIWHVGEYIRLSKEDGDKDESDSVTTQKIILEQFIKKDDSMIIYDVYVDDGFTGTNFDRPNFQRLIEDMKKGKLNCIVVKDLSRLGREYIGVGDYVEKVFPLLGIRFIAINDGMDTYLKTNMQIAPFKSVLNDMYSQDLSLKVKSAIRANANIGQYISGNIPYGYLKDPDSKRHLIIDTEISHVIKEIFQLKLEGYSLRAIVGKMHDYGYLSPSNYKNNNGKKWSAGSNIKNDWGTSTIQHILENEVYIGNLVRCKTTRINHKIKKRINVDEDQQVRAENTHEPIIDIETWNQVQEVIKKPYSQTIKKPPHKYAGYLVCGDCGRKMIINNCGGYLKNGVTPKKRFQYYVCGGYRNNGINTCTSKSTKVEEFDEVVLRRIQQETILALKVNDIVEIVNKVENSLTVRKNVNNQLQKLEIRKQQIFKLKKAIYEDKVNKEITHEDYKSLKVEYDREEEEVNNKIEKIKDTKNEEDKKIDSHNLWLSRYKKYANITEITREVIVELIDEIVFYDDNQIKIKLKHMSEFAHIMEELSIVPVSSNPKMLIQKDNFIELLETLEFMLFELRQEKIS